MNSNKVVLLILDGWGLSEEKEYNAIAKSKTPNFDYLWNNFPHSVLEASGKAVGLPEGQMGNSEVGHLTIGAGRVIYQSLEKINKAIEENLLEKNPLLAQVFEKVKKHNSALHIKGLVSPGGVHSHEQHLYALIDLAKKSGVPRVFVHAFTDGKDTPPKSAEQYVENLEKVCKDSGIACVASVSGRYYAMDRDNNWERTQCAFNAIAKGEGKKYNSAIEAIRESYKAGKTDEFIEPCVLPVAKGKTCEVADNDAMIFFNFRADRVRQLAQKFKEECRAENLTYLTMADYDGNMKKEDVVFGPEDIKNGLSEILSKKGLKQFRVTETDKYTHVTFYLDGGREKPYEGEKALFIPSNKVATHDLAPEMKAKEIADEVVGAIKNDYDFIVANFVNLDIVGHTGKIEPAIKAVEAVDESLGKVLEAVKKYGCFLIVTADHGNAETMFDPQTNQPHTAHTGNPVPFILMKKDFKLSEKGKLADIAPTILQIMNLEKPKEMTGVSLMEK